MKLRIEQDYTYRGNDYWNWRAWIGGGDAELQRVKSVKWLLHPTFSPSFVVRENAANRFLLETSGWGTFLLRAELTLTNGETVKLRRNLELEYPDEEPSTPPLRGTVILTEGPGRGLESARPGVFGQHIKSVFLSVGSADRRRVAPLKESLEKLGLSVIDATQVPPGAPLDLAISDLLSRADATVAYVSSNTPSAFVAQEVNASWDAGKPTLVVTDEDLGPIYGVPEKVQVRQLELNNFEQVTATVDSLKRQI